ncbi:hypothetical protein ABZ842_38615, partial [Streptomyces sp. NPDC047315]
PYTHSRRTGAFLLIDPNDGTTLTAAMTGDSFVTAARSARSAAEPTGGADEQDEKSEWDF